jgi:hypothetical protein
VLELIRRCVPEVAAIELRHAQGRVQRVALTLNDGTRREAVLRRAPPHEIELYRSGTLDAKTGAPACLGWTEEYVLLEALPEHFPNFSVVDDVIRAYTHLAALHQHFRHGAVTLIHGDYHRWNLVLDETGVRVLDWEHARWGRPIWDLVLLAPEEPGWDGVPRGRLAEVALRTYHAAGPLAGLSWSLFLRLQMQARLIVAARWARVHQAKADAMAPGAPREQIEAYAALERERVRRLAGYLSKRRQP